MTTIVTRVAGALLALAGLVLTVVGAWFAAQLGASGTAEFTARPGTTDPVLIRPDVLNRVDEDVVVTATAAEGATVWMALANPSDAAAVVGDSRHVDVTGVSVRDWALLTRTTGSGEAPELGAADLWRQQDDAPAAVTLTVEQDEAPETLVVATEGGELRTLTMTVVDKTWFVEAVIAVLVGVFLLLAGGALLWPRGERADVPDEPLAPEPATGHRDPEEVTR
ncbi:hypothetical protein GCM10023168_09150 [Fodinibacter luteus]|uniref:Uncharacterized protein n=1 Tax=Fodinibacter luteus TaxID=552064 RepID=A0ABP8K4E0_9MICO